MSEEGYLVRTVGGPHPGTRVFDPARIPWPPPQQLEDEGGRYVKTSQSGLPAQEPGSHVMRGAEYEWRPDASVREVV